MTIELTILVALSVLAASLWIPFIIGVNTTEFAMPEDNRPFDVSGTVPWVHRAYRAHLNLLEQFLPFAIIILIAHVAGVSNPVTVWGSAAFLGLRLGHAVWMIGGYPVLPVRPLLFTGGWVCILAIAVATIWG